MPIARCITRYCVTMKEDSQFTSWVFQASHDAESWITLHVGKSAFVGRDCFNISNNRYYEYYRVKVYNWIGIPGIPELDFYEKVVDHTTTTSSYTTTTYTSTTLTTISHTHTTTTTTETSSTTAAPIYNSLSYLNLSGNASNYELVWNIFPSAAYYELQVRYNSGSYSPFLYSVDNTYQGENLPSTANTVQFRVRFHLEGTIVSPWTESNILTLPVVTADFKAVYKDTESSTFLRVNYLGQRLQLFDLSSSSHGDIVSWSWVFYTDNLGKSIYNATSSFKNPHYTYLTRGLYAVRLTVTDESGRSNTILKTNFIEVNSQLIADFYTIDLDNNRCFEYIEVPYGSTVRFIDSSSSGDIADRQWEFCKSAEYGGSCETSTLKQVSRVYNTPGNYAVGLRIIGVYGQTDFIAKSSFVRVTAERSTSTTTTTWATSTRTTTTGTTLTTTTLTTSPPDNWERIPLRNGIPICDSYEIGHEPYKAFDGDEISEWSPIYSSTITSTTTTTGTSTTATTVITTTTIDYFLLGRDVDPLWLTETDISDFRERFIQLVTPKNVFKLVEFDVLPPFDEGYSGSFVYEILHDEFYVGLESSWAQVNADYVLHVLSHATSQDPVIEIGEQPPEDVYPGVIWIIPDPPTTSVTTTTTTTMTTAWIGNECLGNYPQCSSFTPDHDCVNAYDGDQTTYWESYNLVTEQSSEWLGFYWTTSKVIKWYKFFCSSHGTPKIWSLIASKNGITWVTIDYRYDQNIEGWNWFAIDNDTDYRFYRIHFYETVDSNRPRVYSLEMYQSIITTTTSTESTATTTGPP